jgi:acetylornithine/succinyldiaminopimelate/putrescine aminotransferase
VVELYERHLNPRRLAALRASFGERVFVRARGTELEDAEGKRYLDLVCGFGAATLGHRHPRVMEAIAATAAEGPPFTSPFAVPSAASELAAKLASFSRSERRLQFCSSGAEGIETALKFASAATGRGAFLSFEGGFHGLTTGALRLAGSPFWCQRFAELGGLRVERLPFGSLEAARHALSSGQFAAVVLEPIQGLGGARAFGAEELAELAEAASRSGTLLVADEVLTGGGRTGAWFASEARGFEPDILVCSKGLSGGVVPIAAVSMRPQVHDSVFSSPEQAYVHSSTFEGNLLAARVALCVLETIENDGLLERVRALGSLFRNGLERLKNDGLGIEEIRAHGALIAFRIAGLDAPNDAYGGLLCVQRLFERGVITCSASHDPRFVKLTPAFTTSDDDVARFLSTLEEVLGELAEERSAMIEQ